MTKLPLQTYIPSQCDVVIINNTIHISFIKDGETLCIDIYSLVKPNTQSGWLQLNLLEYLHVNTLELIRTNFNHRRPNIKSLINNNILYIGHCNHMIAYDLDKMAVTIYNTDDTFLICNMLIVDDLIYIVGGFSITNPFQSI